MKIGAAWLALTVPVLAVAVVLLVLTIRSLIDVMRSSIVASVPLRAEMRIALPRAGDYDLYVEGAFMSRDFGALEFFLTDASGAPVALHAVLFRTRVSSFSRVRLQLRHFQVAGAGTFTLRLTGIRENQDAENRIVIASPVTAKMVLH
ncbi:MAG TPA: hypothetical protein VGP71_10390, partial [Burkholderiales bacterium]|nr:hypothetical protein [Burkholderiales bacterium]